jgi:RNA polymerase sigma-70 factor (ECF subfamily)
MLPNVTLLAADAKLTDDLIISRILLGKRDYYEVLVRRYNSLLYKTARGILSKEEDIEDIMQEAYIRGFEKLHQFRKESRFSTWLGRIVINCALQHLNSLKKKSYVSLDSLQLEEGENLMDESIEEGNPQVGENLKKVLESAIGHLPSKYRVVFILREVEQISVADTAAILEISEENVKIRLHRAKNMLKDMLKTEGESLDLFHFHASRCAHIASRVMTHINSRIIYPFGNIPRTTYPDVEIKGADEA